MKPDQCLLRQTSLEASQVHGESRDDVESERDDPQDGALLETFAVRPKRSQRRHEERSDSANSWLYMDDEAHGEPYVNGHEGGEAENQERRDDEVPAGHARERSVQ